MRFNASRKRSQNHQLSYERVSRIFAQLAFIGSRLHLLQVRRCC